MMLRLSFYILSVLSLLAVAILAPFYPGALYFLLLIIPLIGIGIHDVTRAHHNVLTNYPVIGHLRYMMEFISPEIRQYFLESDKSGRPYTRQERALIKSRAHGQEAVHPFG
ncbi:MAG: FMN-binding glutamate synthase family protein, partial [Oleiagrimonas sp.]|nr:FMN-binding glutamate synthase family protein [Oleiagrimonas sp.]